MERAPYPGTGARLVINRLLSCYGLARRATYGHICTSRAKFDLTVVVRCLAQAC